MTKRRTSIDANEVQALGAVEMSVFIDDLLARMAADTAVATVRELLPHSDVKPAVWAGKVRELIAHLASDGELSQRAFWRFYEDVQGNRQPDLWITDGH